MTTGVFFDGAGNLQYSDFCGFLGLLCICLQLAAMRWSTYALNTLLTVFSVLLFTEMVTLASPPCFAALLPPPMAVPNAEYAYTYPPVILTVPHVPTEELEPAPPAIF